MAKESLLVGFAAGLVPLGVYYQVSYMTNPYTALRTKDAFRVLILEPESRLQSGKPGKSADPLRCTLKHLSSFHEVEYEAVSYAWGEADSAGPELILCNGRPLFIQPNLASALRTLRHPNKVRILWADAICINQQDILERAGQVSQMREIYANARKVIIWLGSERQADKQAFDFLKWLAVYFDQQGNVWKTDLTESGPEGEWAQIKVDHASKFEALRSLLHRDWFIRTWVVQELASAQSASLMKGHDTITWDVVSDVLTKLQHPSFLVDYLEDEKTLTALNSVVAMETVRRSVNGTFDLSLFQILLATCFNTCSDKRDKVYAVLGLAKDWLEKGGLDPDYDRKTTPEEVFKRFAMWDVQRNGQIRVLSCTTASEESTALPSWVPDWTKIENGQPFVLYSGRTRFSASGGLSTQAWYSDHGRMLHTIGEVVDSIRVVRPASQFCKTLPSDSSFETHAQVSELITWLAECHRLAADAQGLLSEDRYEQFWRTMTCELTGDAHPVPSEYGNYFRKYWGFLEAMGKSLPTLPPCRGQEADELDSTSFDSIAHDLVESSLITWASRRRFCTTTSGRLAFMPPIAREGDLICILYGGEVPYLLRRRADGTYMVVGECYVNGIMHGEALSMDAAQSRHFKIT
ncbi:hypothetical protein VTL71DRAFT_3103 [Oculimacula yallundae]|uniref:Heterokaryon incompatibility domain-containing protein n=1 Tax=Oculimacula yallundae TaxID=86028 RepID=A0ABR4C663_9HELO